MTFLCRPRDMKTISLVSISLKQGSQAYSLPEKLAYYRKESGSLTSNKWESLTWAWQVYRKSQKLSFLSAGFIWPTIIIRGMRKHYF